MRALSLLSRDKIRRKVKEIPNYPFVSVCQRKRKAKIAVKRELSSMLELSSVSDLSNGEPKARFYLLKACTRSTKNQTHIAAKTAKKMMTSHRGVSAMNLDSSSISGYVLFFAAKVRLFFEKRCGNFDNGVTKTTIKRRKV